MKRGVSLYSYREGDYNEYLSLERQLKEIGSIPGADGIELLPQLTRFCDYPNPKVADVDRWFKYMEKYKLKPICLDSEIGATLLRGRNASFEEQVLLFSEELRLAKMFGFEMVRVPTFYGFEQSVMEECIPLAEDLDVKMSFEIHCPFTVGSRDVQSYLDIIKRTGTKYMGFIPDLAIYSKNVPHLLVEHVLKHGADEKLVNYVVEGFRNREDMTIISKEVENKDSSKNMKLLLEGAREYNKNGNPEDLKEIAPYVTHVHGKFYDVTEDYTDNDINWEMALNVLKNNGFDGYVISEFEGQQYYYPEDGEMYDEVEQVRRHQEMLRKYMEE